MKVFAFSDVWLKHVVGDDDECGRQRIWAFCLASFFLINLHFYQLMA